MHDRGVDELMAEWRAIHATGDEERERAWIEGLSERELDAAVAHVEATLQHFAEVSEPFMAYVKEACVPIAEWLREVGARLPRSTRA